MNEEEIRRIVLQVISERTWPDVYISADGDWLVPLKRLMGENERLTPIFEHINRLTREVARLEEWCRERGYTP